MLKNDDDETEDVNNAEKSASLETEEESDVEVSFFHLFTFYVVYTTFAQAEVKQIQLSYVLSF